MNEWSRAEKLALCSIAIACMGTLATWLVVPEFRRMLNFSSDHTLESTPNNSKSTNNRPLALVTKPSNTLTPTPTASVESEGNSLDKRLLGSWSFEAMILTFLPDGTGIQYWHHNELFGKFKYSLSGNVLSTTYVGSEKVWIYHISIEGDNLTMNGDAGGTPVWKRTRNPQK